MKKFLFPVKFFLFIFEFIFKPQIQQQTKAPNFSHPAKHFRKVVQRRSEIMNEHATCVNTFAIIIFIFCEILLLRVSKSAYSSAFEPSTNFGTHKKRPFIINANR